MRSPTLAYLPLALLILLPILLVQVPMLADYPNHLARMHILATIDSSPELQRFYEVEWRLAPYLAMDAVVPVLARVMSLYDAGRVFIVACMLLPVAGVAAIHYVAHRRVSVVPIGAFLFTYNQVLGSGFMNYLFAMGLALLLLAGWMASERWPRTWRILLFTLAATLLYLAHVFAFAIYCIAVAGFEFGRAFRSRFAAPRAVAADWLVAASQAIPSLILAALVNLRPGAQSPYYTSFGDLDARLMALWSPVAFLSSGIDHAVGAIIVAGLAVGLLTGRLRMSPVVLPIVLTLAAAAVGCPEYLFAAWGAHLRPPVVVALVLIGGLSVDLPRRGAVALFAAVSALIALKTAEATASLLATGRQVAELQRVLAPLPRGAKLLGAEVSTGEAKNRVAPHGRMGHAALLATIERDAFVPKLFNLITPVEPRSDMRPLSDNLQGKHPRLQDLLAVLEPSPSQQADGDATRRVYWRDWPTHFDYLLWQHFGADPPASLPSFLQSVAGGPLFNLYRITRE